jgi:hypothetical protein
MNIEWQHRPMYAGDVFGELKETTDCWIATNGVDSWAIYQKQDGRWYLFYWRFRGESWDTLDEAKIVSTTLYRMGHFDQWDSNN